MMDLILTKEFWIVSTVWALIINVLASFVFRRLDGFLGSISTYWRKRSTVRLTKWNNLIDGLSLSGEDRSYVLVTSSMLAGQAAYMQSIGIMLFLGALFMPYGEYAVFPVRVIALFLSSFMVVFSLMKFFQAIKLHKAVNLAREKAFGVEKAGTPAI